jgi:predicted RND superfamily exporter protein
MHNWDVKKTVAISLKETGLSIVYTSLILLFGFGIFMLSSFGSTFNLGLLTSITLVCALFTNIVLIPALLCAFDKEPKRIWSKKRT